MSEHQYVIALGSNMRHPRYGSPRSVLRAALAHMPSYGIHVERVSSFWDNPPIGPSLRRYVNAAAVVHSDSAPEDFLWKLHALEHAFGRKRAGMAWRSRVLDIDIIFWDKGGFKGRKAHKFGHEGLIIPHAEYAKRDFVLKPTAQIAQNWKNPSTGLSVQHYLTRLTKSN